LGTLTNLFRREVFEVKKERGKKAQAMRIKTQHTREKRGYHVQGYESAEKLILRRRLAIERRGEKKPPEKEGV